MATWPEKICNAAAEQSNMIIGRQPLLEAPEHRKSIERIFMLRTATGDIIPQTRELAQTNNIPVNYVPVESSTGLPRPTDQEW